MLHHFSFESKQKQEQEQEYHQPSSSSTIETNGTTTNYNLNSTQQNTTFTTRSTTSSQPSPTLSLTNEYISAIHTTSYNEIWSKIHIYNPNEDDDEEVVVHANNASTSSSLNHDHLVSQVLQPNRELVDQALHRVKPTNLTRLVSTYFDHSEQTTRLLCLLLHHSIDKARSLYAPLHDLLDILPVDSLSQSQCDRAFEVFVQFNLLDNPFPHPISENFQETRVCFSVLKQQLDHRLVKTRKQKRFYHRFFRNSVLCFSALVSNPLRSTLPSKLLKKQVLHHIAQLDAAAKGAYVLNNDLDTIDRLVARLHAVVESDKVLVRIGLERGRDRYPIQEVVKQLRKNHLNFLNQLKDLEEHVCLCFATVNRARALLLQQIHRQQSM
ncbi:hypothetical protein FRX31_020613 [Thalictrum thalictroides]|uniref:Uncharacterized protein n=1 Tax=Thalictrum thalictroides TaxID=46969 RepID=A0A7J6VXG7_THATH|nr:hypothetical protein FRX31_020613 [Thalictrum thalictroides]